jgi:NTE family protein
MTGPRGLLVAGCAILCALAGCATRPVNPPIERADHAAGYRFETREQYRRDHDSLLMLAFSGGGTRAAAFSYGVLEALHGIRLDPPGGPSTTGLDEVGIIAGVSGGSFTALAFGLYGERLFGDYERRFLKRDVEGELLRRLANPVYWGSLSQGDWGRSDLAAEYYDEILFAGATFGDLERGRGPMIVTSATDISTGARFYFTQAMFDVMCSDLSRVTLSRAAASSSAVPVLLSPVTLDNHGGTCGYRVPDSLAGVVGPGARDRSGARAMREFVELLSYEDRRARPYIHLVDGGIADNIGMRGVLDAMHLIQALRLAGQPTPLDRVKRIAVIVVDSHTDPKTDWDRSPDAPGPFDQLMQATGVPIEHYSFESVETLRDMAARWRMLRAIRDSGAIRDPANPALAEVMRVPDTEIYVVDVSFAALADAAERDYLNALPTSFALSAEAVDRLRAAAARIVADAPEFRRFLRDAGYVVVPR